MAPATSHRKTRNEFCLASLVIAAALLFPSSSAGQQPVSQPAQQAAAAPPTRVFGSETGLMLNFIKADKTADFETVMAKVRNALANSSNPMRKLQGASWRVFKSPDPGPAGSVLYVCIIDPVVKGADYSVSPILAEAFPAEEYAALQKQYIGAYATGQNFVNLTLLPDVVK